MNHPNLRKLALALNILLVIFFSIGVYYMFFSNNSGGVLASNGLDNLKYFTVLSNMLAGIIAIISLIGTLIKKRPVLVIWKFIAAAEVGLTFFIVAGFLAPMYPNLNMYARGNLYFHLLCPLAAMLEMILLGITEGKIPFKLSLLPMIPTALYATGYLANNLINGTGEWPNSNDFYGFLNWGLPVGMVIFVISVLLTWGIALLLRLSGVIAERTKQK